jgi:hypothetical protein
VAVAAHRRSALGGRAAASGRSRGARGHTEALAAAWRLRGLGVERLHAHFANQTADCAAIAAGVAGLPFSFTAHAYDIYSTAPRQRNATLDWKLRHAARVFTVNRYARDLLRERLTAVEQGRVCTAYVGIPTRSSTGPPPDGDGLRPLCVARFQEKKGLDTLVDACRAARPGRPVPPRLIGDGRRRPSAGAGAAPRAQAHVEPPAHAGRRWRGHSATVNASSWMCRRDRTGDMTASRRCSRKRWRRRARW